MTHSRRYRAQDALTGIVRRTRWAIALERAVRAFWPLASLAAVVWAALAFGLAEALSRTQLMAVLGTAGLAALVLAGIGLRQFRWPSAAEARARIDSVLPGRPLAALEDRLALGRDDPAAETVWALHLERMRRAARAARVAVPDLRLAGRDPWALRLMALVLLITALVFARGDGIDGLGTALAPAGSAAVASGPSFEGWARPPGYTGWPTLYLSEVPGNRPVRVPQGTEITLRAYGPPAEFDLAENVTPEGAQELSEAAAGIGSASFTVERTGSVILRRGEENLGEWSFIMQPDQPPQIELAGEVGRAVSGEMQLSYEARDDYGVTGARAEIVLDLPQVDRRYGLAVEPVAREVLQVDLPLPVAGGTQEIAETLVEDFSKHPWVGLPVRITLIAEDGLGQLGHHRDAEAVLPGRRFFDPMAAALIEQRRDVLWAPDANARRVAQVLRALTYKPEDHFDNPRAFLVTRTAIRWLVRAREEGEVGAVAEEVAEMLWQAALLLEEGSLGDAAERLARAQERLREALQNDASDEEIAQLMDELRQATRDYMEQLAQEAIRRGEQQQAQNQQGQSMTTDQIQELMNRIQELSEQGRRAEAEQLLEMLRQLLENMEMQLAEGGQGQGQGGQGQQAMEDLADTLREQQDLADESFQQLQREFRQGQQGQQGQQGGEQGAQPGQGRGDGEDGPPSAEELAQRQEALRELLENLERGLPGATGEPGEAAREALRQAERNMGDARDSLEDGNTAGALDRQADAIDNLREGMRGLGEEMRQAQQGGDQQGQQPGDGFAEGRNDPLGRPTGQRGNVGTNERMVPDADMQARARALLDEIRRRSGEQARPQIELDYLRRLLERF
jgi:uncharacterized protein (TIGR02302 family)